MQDRPLNKSETRTLQRIARESPACSIARCDMLHVHRFWRRGLIADGTTPATLQITPAGRAALGLPPTPAPARVACPHCGNDDLSQIVWQEWIPSTRNIGIYADGKLYIDASGYKDHGDCARGDELVCLKCPGESFPIPAGVDVEHAEPSDIEARIAAGPIAQPGIFAPG